MASNHVLFARATLIPPPNLKIPFPPDLTVTTNRSRAVIGRVRIRMRRVRVSGGGSSDSYLEMWRNAMERERKESETRRMIADQPDNGEGDESDDADLERKSEEFKKIQEVSKEERDRVQRLQVIDRAAAAIAAARAVLEESRDRGNGTDGDLDEIGGGGESEKGIIFVPRSESSRNGVPGPDFWSWTPPPGGASNLDDAGRLQEAQKYSVQPNLTSPVAEKDRSMGFLSIPFESKVSGATHNRPLPPLQSLMEVDKVDTFESSPEMLSAKEEEHEVGTLFLAHAAEAAYVLDEDKVDDSTSSGVNADGSMWWKERGIERRADGVICRWTMLRGVSADQEVEWQEKFWEAADEFGYKELGSEKSGRDATGSVWREYWRESMSQESGLVHLEKTADKWGKNGKGDEWQEKWWEHYDASNKSEKWAHKWCSIDPTTQLEAGHAHVWHERWGEKYDGLGGSVKYTDKWAERCEGDAWTKWGDKWDEHFDSDGHGVKQGETWWEGVYGERWNRTWGERHNGSGWVHKYGKSSSGEHWDTHVEQETWYEKFPHYSFCHCFDNSVQLRKVKKPSESD